MHSTSLSRRRLTLLTVSLSTALALSACGTADNPAVSGAGEPTLSTEDVTLRLTWWGGDARHERTQQAIAAFEEEYPNIDVEGEFGDWTGYWDKLATAVAGGNAPDVIQMDQLYLASYADRGVLADLETLPQLDASRLDPAVLDTGRSGDTLAGMPISGGAWSVMVNKTKLDELGLTLPDTDTWTWDEFTAFAQSVTQASGGSTVGVTPWSNEFALQIYARQHSDELFKDGDVAIDPQTLAGFFQQAADWSASGASQPASQFAEQVAAALDQTDFSTGKSAMIFATPTQLTAYSAAAGGADIVLAPLPTDEDTPADYMYLKPGMYWSVAAESQHPAEAALLVDFLVNSTTAGEIIGAERGIPVNSEVRDVISTALTPEETESLTFTESIEDKLGAAPEIVPNGASELDKLIARYVQEVMFGQSTAADAADAFIAEVQASIDAA